MDLASRFAYLDLTVSKDPERPTTVEVNRKTYVLLDAEHDTVNGLDAFTFRNEETGEITVVFQGSSGGTDWANNALLLTSVTPAQFEAAEAYVDRVGREFGPVSFASGNSLGGGLAADVGAVHPEIEVVTVNPAPVPAGFANMAAPNVHNYLVENDMLHQLVVAGGMADRIIGEQITVAGTATNDVFGPNHIGSLREDGRYDASMGTPFSLFHENALVSVGDYGGLVDLTPEALEQMAQGLIIQQVDLLDLARDQLEHLHSMLIGYEADLAEREDAARAVIEGLVGAGLAELRRRIEAVRADLEGLRPLVRRLPVPLAARLVWPPVADLLVRALDAALAGLAEVAELGASAVVEVAWRAYGVVFTDAAQCLTSGLRDQRAEVDDDLRVVLAKSTTFVAMAVVLARQMTEVDARMAAAIAARRCPPDALPVLSASWPEGRTEGVTVDVAQRLAWTTTELRDQAVSTLVVSLGAVLAEVLRPSTLTLRLTEAALEEMEERITVGLTAIDKLAAPSEFLGRLVGLDDDVARFREDVRDLRVAIRNRVDVALEDLRVQRRLLLEDLPALVWSAEPQLRDLLFSDRTVDEAVDGFSQVRNVVERFGLAFGEVDHQLGEHSARAISALAERAADLDGDLATVGDALGEIVP